MPNWFFVGIMLITIFGRTCSNTTESAQSNLVNYHGEIIDNSSQCLTIGGNKPDLPCIFPFSIRTAVLTFNACFWKDDIGNFICSTKVNEGGIHVTGHSGICSESCPKTCVRYFSWPCNGTCIPLGERDAKKITCYL